VIRAYAAMRFRAAGVPVSEVFTFGAPRVGDAEFAAAYDHAVTAFRYECMDDVVPHVPPDPTFVHIFSRLPNVDPQSHALVPFDYAHVGTLRFINWDRQIVPESISLNMVRLLHLAKLVACGQIGKLATDHDPSCGGGYMSQACPGVCPVP
jgi:hypothetical protein